MESESTPTPTGTQTDAGADALFLKFISELRQLLPIERIREVIRVTPKGLFVQHAALDQIVELFRVWFERQTGGEIVRSPQKIRRRLLGSDDAPLHYLSEGKLSLSGYLLPVMIREPQKYHLPFFLGSLSDTRATLHPSDPIFSSLKGVTASPSPEGLEVTMRLGEELISFRPAQIKEFGEHAEHSPRTAKEFPELRSSLAETLRALVTLLQRSRSPRKETRFLLPYKFLDQKRFSYRSVGGFVFIFDKRQRMQRIVELRGRNLFHLVREELAALPAAGTKRIGSFEIFSQRHQYLGAFHLPGREIKLAPRALVAFVEGLHDSPDKRDQFPAHYSIRQAFERFSTVFQTAQPIAAHLISSYIDPKRARGLTYSVNGSWLFALSNAGVVEQCIAKHHGIRRERRGPPGAAGRGRPEGRPRGSGHRQ